MKNIGLLILIAIAILLPAGCTPAPQSGGGGGGVTPDISIRDNYFDPATFSAVSGETVVWKNLGTSTHTVISTSGPFSFDSGDVSSGATFSYTFNGTGTCEYHCGIHAGMTGQINVH